MLFRAPNVRKMFVPPPGRGFGDIDLDSADLRIVTWESDCRGMKTLFVEGKKPYLEVAREYYHDQTIKKALPSGAPDPRYQTFKKLCHGTNYLGKAPTIAGQCGLLVHETERIQKWYFGMFPEIKRWQDAFAEEFYRTGIVRNPWGNRTVFHGRLEGNAINEAIAWLPQSTVGLLINRIWRNIDRNLPEVWVHLQVHDSLGFSYPLDREEHHLDSVRQNARIVIPYEDPLIIPVGFKTSHISWGDCG